MRFRMASASYVASICDRNQLPAAPMIALSTLPCKGLAQLSIFHFLPIQAVTSAIDSLKAAD